MITLILPIAGGSFRFPNTRPKFLLTHPLGNTLLTESIRGLPLKKIDKIVIIGLKEHQVKYRYIKDLKKELYEVYGILGNKLEFVLLKNKTKNQPETIVKGIEDLKISGQILIKDCDNYFETNDIQGNFVSVYSLNNLKSVNASNKSYIKFGKKGEVVNIVEKSIIGDKFCCGLYGFSEASNFLDSYYFLKKYDDLYVSHIIYHRILKVPYK